MRTTAALALFWLSGAVLADTVKVAVASNFRPTLELLAVEFRRQSGHELRISAAASGVLYQQLRHGADFQVLLSADAERPQALYRDSFGAQPPFTYALGRLALVAARGAELPDSADTMSVVALLAQAPARTVAIANPRVAPYGVAARSLYEKLGLWDSTADSRVEAGNIGQAYLLVQRGHARYGFVAQAQAQSGPLRALTLPAAWHPSIEQQGLLLQSAADHAASREFVAFMQSEPAQAIIERAGYTRAGQQ